MRRGGPPAGRRKDEGNREVPSAERDILADRKRLGDLIEAATCSPLLHLDDRALSSIKSLVRASDTNVEAAFDFLLDRLKKNHSQVRYLAVLLVDELVTRSKLFRALLVPQFETFLLLSVGFRADYPLPPPVDRAALLRKKSTELVEKWKVMFGQHYKQIRLGHDYLKNTLQVEFPNALEAATLASQQRREREQRTQELLKKKFQILKEEFPNLKADVQSTLEEIEQCLQILAPPPSTPEAALDGTTSNDDGNDGDDGEFDDEDFESYGVESLRHLRDVVEEQDTVPHESTDNSALFDTLRDLYKLLTTRHLVNSQESLTTLMKVDPEEDRQSRDTFLRDVIDLRNLQLKARAKCEGLGIQRIEAGATGTGDELDDEIWEQGDVATIDAVAQNSAVGPSRATDAASSRVVPPKSTTVNDNKPKGKEAVGAVKHELLQQAPVLPWGSFLDTWGSQSAVPANPRGLEFENHWGKVDYDVMIPAEKIAEISVRASYYKAPKIEIQPCLAPLRNGGLCQRRDLRKCPLHGPIRPRDEKGNVIPDDVDITQSSRLREVEIETSNQTIRDDGVSIDDIAQSSSRREGGVATSNQTVGDDDGSRADGDGGLSRNRLAEEAVGNVRRMDEQARAHARRQRAKRTREHNEACLRDAAMSEIRLGFGEAFGGALDDGIDAAGSRTKKPRGGLSALLRKKPTAKDRLARRLLNGRVTEATTNQLVRDQEAAYRESFPNQWTMK